MLSVLPTKEVFQFGMLVSHISEALLCPKAECATSRLLPWQGYLQMSLCTRTGEAPNFRTLRDA